MNEKNSYRLFIRGVLDSYSQVFFSTNRIFAWIILVVTFFDLVSGLSGLLAVLTANGLAWLTGFNREKIARGYYGFNSLLVGLGLGLYYQFTPEFVAILLFGSVFTFFLTVVMEGVIGKYNLPYLSVPFILGIWMIILASRQFTYLETSERGVYYINEMYVLGGMTMVRVYDWFNNVPLPQSLVIYFRSLGAIFFQYHLFPGLILALGLMIYSRIGFLLSLFGFYAAYIFYQLVGADLATLNYTYIGFNFILTAIAIGGFFVIPSWYSFLWVLILTPISSIILTSTATLFNPLQLSIYSLPFNIVVLLFIYAMKFRERYYSHPELVIYQQFSPERNLYSQKNNRLRFGEFLASRFFLPFWGEWKVTQGHSGQHTHKDNWKEAWDFEIMDEEGKTYRDNGERLEDYYCYGKPVIAPADGWVEKISDNVEDNAIGKVNLEQNWGNTVVIRHNDKLFSSMSHLKQGSIKVKRGDYLKRGDTIGLCGNSGRSPAPHLHFQFQETPQIGSKTIAVPFSNYILDNESELSLMSNEKPLEGELVSNIELNTSIQKSFTFVPGQLLHFLYKKPEGEVSEELEWEVKADIYNNTYLECPASGSKAYFRTESDMFFFTHFEGDRKSPLFLFYLGCYKIIFGQYARMKVRDTFPVDNLVSGYWKILQDFLAPFHLFIRSSYRLEFVRTGTHFMDDQFLFRSHAQISIGDRILREASFEISLREESIEKIIIYEEGEISGELIWQSSS